MTGVKMLSILGGFIASLGMFVIGLAAATLVLTAEPQRKPGPSLDVAGLWTAEPRKVNRASQPFERLPSLQTPRSPHPSSSEARSAAAVASGAVDTVTTGSGQTGATQDHPEAVTQSHDVAEAHVEWCASRYRSYRPDDNSYTRYDGQQWPCVSPYSKHLAAERISRAPSDAESYEAEQLPWLDASVDEGVSHPTSDHISYCFSRYRSYRPDDNSYQPYGGGPRRQCR